MKKYILTLMTVMTAVFGAWATDYAFTLVLNLNDNTKVNYLFENSPVAMIEGDDLKITEVATMQEVVYPIADITNMTFEKEPIDSGVKSILGANEVAFGLTRSTLDIYGVESGTDLYIYDIAGALVVKGISGADHSASLDISNLEKGVYTVKAGKYSFKFIR